MANDLPGGGSDPSGTTSSGRASRFPVAQLRVRTLNPLNFTAWELQLKDICNDLKCLAILESSSPDHEFDLKARRFMLDTVPDDMHNKVARCKSAFEAYSIIKEQFTDGKNPIYVRELENKLDKLKMLPNESVDKYIHRAEELHDRLSDNLRKPLPDVFLDKVVDGLPSAFNDAKVAMKVMTEGRTLESLKRSIVKAGINIGWEPGKDVDKVKENVPIALNVGGQAPGVGKGKKKFRGQGRNP